MPTTATEIDVDGVRVSNPRGRAIQAVMFVRWPFHPPRTKGGIPVLPSFGGTRPEIVSAGARLPAAVDACRRHGGTVLEVHKL